MEFERLGAVEPLTGRQAVLGHAQAVQAQLVPQPDGRRQRRRRGVAQIASDNGRRHAVGNQPPALKQQRSATQLLDDLHVVTDQQHRPPSLGDAVHGPQALLLEGGVAHGQYLVDQQNLRLEMGRDGKGQPHAHAAGVALHRRVDELIHLGEGDDLVEAAFDLGLAHAQDGAVEVDVLATSQFRVEAGADFQQAADAAVEDDPTARRRGDA